MKGFLRIFGLLAFSFALLGLVCTASAATSGFTLSKGQTAQPFKDITISFVSASSGFFAKQAILEVSGAAHPSINCYPNDTKPSRANLNFDFLSVISPFGGSTTTSSTCTTDSGSFTITTYRDYVSEGKAAFFIRAKPKDKSKDVIITAPTGKTLADFLGGQAAPSPTAGAAGTGTTPKAGATPAGGTGNQAAAKSVSLDSVSPNTNIDLSNFPSLEVVFTPHFVIKQYTVEIWQRQGDKLVDNSRKQIASCKSGTNCIELAPNASNYAADSKMTVKLDRTRDTAFKDAIDKIKSELAPSPGNTYCLRVEVTQYDNPGAISNPWVDTACIDLKFNAVALAEPTECPSNSTVLECLAHIDTYKFSQIFPGLKGSSQADTSSQVNNSSQYNAGFEWGKRLWPEDTAHIELVEYFIKSTTAKENWDFKLGFIEGYLEGSKAAKVVKSQKDAEDAVSLAIGAANETSSYDSGKSAGENLRKYPNSDPVLSEAGRQKGLAGLSGPEKELAWRAGFVRGYAGEKGGKEQLHNALRIYLALP